MSDAPEWKDAADWSDLPDVYVTRVQVQQCMFWKIEACSVPMAIGPELRLVRADRIAELARPKIKPLVWQSFDDNRIGPRYEAASIAGRYVVLKDGAWFSLYLDGSRIGGALPTIKAAKAAAQADFEARILAALKGQVP